MRRSAALKKLKPRRRRFVEEYVSGAAMNATEAARRAGYASRNPQNAHQIAWDIMQDPNVREAIDEYLDAMSMSAAEAVKRLTDWGRGSLEPFLDANGMIDLTTPQARENLHLLRKVEVTEPTEDAAGRIKVEIHDAKDAVIQLARIHGLFVDRVEHSGEIAGVLRVPQLPPVADWTEQAKSQQAQIGNGNGGNRVNGNGRP